jgi:hypothetical protein
LLALSMFLGWNVAGALHELGHAMATKALGGEVHGVVLFHALGSPKTLVSPLSPTDRAIVDAAGVLTSNLVGLVAVLVIPWRRLSNRVGAMAGGFLVFFMAQFADFALTAFSLGNHDGANLAKHAGVSPVVVCLVGLVLFCGSFGLWLKVARFGENVWEVVAPQTVDRRPRAEDRRLRTNGRGLGGQGFHIWDFKSGG